MFDLFGFLIVGQNSPKLAIVIVLELRRLLYYTIAGDRDTKKEQVEQKNLAHTAALYVVESGAMHTFHFQPKSTISSLNLQVF